MKLCPSMFLSVYPSFLSFIFFELASQSSGALCMMLGMGWVRLGGGEISGSF